ncbi:MAG: type II secretion system protein, partial [Mobilitalea sp.]
MKKKKSGFGIVEWLIVIVLLASLLWMAINTRDRLQEVEAMINMGDSKLVLYEGPKSLKDATSEDLKTVGEKLRDFSLMHCTDTLVKVNGYESYVYDTNVNHNRKWFGDYMPTQSRTPVTYFDFEGIANIEVTVPNIDLETVKISPVRYGIEPVIDAANHTISFTVTEQDNYTLIFNDSPSRALHIFTNPLEVNPTKEGDENVIYIGPGEWNIDSIILEDNQTLYIAGGAVVHGIVQANYAKNVKVVGRGIIDGSTFEGWMGKAALVPLKFDFCDGIEIKDILVLNPNAWVCSANTSKNAVI